MRKMLNNNELNSINENIIDELLTVESLIKTTIDNCVSKECSSQYYRCENISRQLSKERNDYINVLTAALEKIKHIQMLNDEIEILITKTRI